MSISALKVELAKKLLDIEDRDIILQIKNLLENINSQALDKYPVTVKDDILKGLEESENGDTISNHAAFEFIEKWRTRK
jgi:hypothetical protein